MSELRIPRTDEARPISEWTEEEFAIFFDDEANEQNDREARLEQLREEFETSAKTWANGLDQSPHRDPAVYGFCPVPTNADELFVDVTDWHKSSLPCFAPGTPWDEMVTAGAHYISARDFREFDRKKALMIWKLRNA